MVKIAVVRRDGIVVGIFQQDSEAAECAKSLLNSGVDRSQITCKKEEKNKVFSQSFGVAEGPYQTVNSYLKSLGSLDLSTKVKRALKEFGAIPDEGGFYRQKPILVVYSYVLRESKKFQNSGSF